VSQSVRIETVTPKKAQGWLAGNVDNRKLRETRVVHLARILSQGEWELTGDAIVFDDQDVLINGQHRLSAVVVAGVAARFVILRGVPTRTQEVMDQNLSRSLADQLQRRGIGMQFVVASALGWLYQFDYTERTGNVHYADPSMRPTLRQLLKLFEDNQGLVGESHTVGKLTYYLKTRPGPTLAAKHRLLAVDAEEAEIFFKHLQEGTGLSKNDPIWRLREWCLFDKSTARTAGRAPAYRYLALVFKAWNYWREGQTLQRLNWVYSPTKKEAWPIPR
jgi:hypothetical protein